MRIIAPIPIFLLEITPSLVLPTLRFATFSFSSPPPSSTPPFKRDHSPLSSQTLFPFWWQFKHLYGIKLKEIKFFLYLGKSRLKNSDSSSLWESKDYLQTKIIIFLHHRKLFQFIKLMSYLSSSMYMFIYLLHALLYKLICINAYISIISLYLPIPQVISFFDFIFLSQLHIYIYYTGHFSMDLLPYCFVNKSYWCTYCLLLVIPFLGNNTNRRSVGLKGSSIIW